MDQLSGGGSVTSEIREQDQLASGLGRPGHGYGRPAGLWVPPNRFGVPLGLAGLATAWHAAGAELGTPPAGSGGLDLPAAPGPPGVGLPWRSPGPPPGFARPRAAVHAPLVAGPPIFP